MVPTLLLQPIIENAILHGLMHKADGGGEIIVNFKLGEDIIICSIEDNGVGRKLATSLKKEKNKSYGINITRERLDMINSKNQGEHSLAIEDLVDENGEGAGTRVIVKMPNRLKDD